VFLEVEPPSPDPAVVFSSVPDLQSVWMWNPDTGTVQFVQDPNTLLPEEPRWLVYIPGEAGIPGRRTEVPFS